MNKSSWLLNRLLTGSIAILIMCGFGYLAALWDAAPKVSPFMELPPTPSRSRFAYVVVVLVCMGLMALASIAVGRILSESDRKAHGIIGWSVVMTGAWSLVLLTAAPHFATCPSDPGFGVTCSVASQSAAHWALSMLPWCLALTVLPAVVAFSVRGLLAKPATPSDAKSETFV
jgi:hypothetical protein